MHSRGIDPAARVAYGASTVITSVMAENPLANQAEFGAPKVSAFGAAMKRSASRLSHQAAPIIYAHKFGGDIGVMLVKNMRGTTLPYDTGYEGVLPLVVQPRIVKPLPYGMNHG